MDQTKGLAETAVVKKPEAKVEDKRVVDKLKELLTPKEKPLELKNTISGLRG